MISNRRLVLQKISLRKDLDNPPSHFRCWRRQVWQPDRTRLQELLLLQVPDTLTSMNNSAYIL